MQYNTIKNKLIIYTQGKWVYNTATEDDKAHCPHWYPVIGPIG